MDRPMALTKFAGGRHGHAVGGVHPASHRFPVHWTGDSVSLTATVGDMLDSAVSTFMYASRAVQCHPMGVNSISSGPPHVCPMGRTCGEPDEIKKNTHPKFITAIRPYVHSDCGNHVHQVSIAVSIAQRPAHIVHVHVRHQSRGM